MYKILFSAVASMLITQSPLLARDGGGFHGNTNYHPYSMHNNLHPATWESQYHANLPENRTLDNRKLLDHNNIRPHPYWDAERNQLRYDGNSSEIYPYYYNTASPPGPYYYNPAEPPGYSTENIFNDPPPGNSGITDDIFDASSKPKAQNAPTMLESPPNTHAPSSGSGL